MVSHGGCHHKMGGNYSGKRSQLSADYTIETLQVDGDGVKGRPRKMERSVERRYEKEGTL